MNKLSIITINRNNAEGLRKTIESVVSQTFTNFEYIIIDGASTDNSVDIIRKYADKITYWVSEPDKGIYNAMNKGIQKASGEYLQFLNSGDWLVNSDTLATVFNLQRAEDILYGNEFLFYQSDKIVEKYFNDNLTFNTFYKGSISHEGSFYKKELFKNPYNETYKIVSDWEFELKEIVFNNRSTFKLDEFIIYFDMSGVSQSAQQEQLQAFERNDVLNRYLPEKILLDYKQLEKMEIISELSLFPYVELFSTKPFLQRLVRGFMKFILTITGNSNLIPKR